MQASTHHPLLRNTDETHSKSSKAEALRYVILFVGALAMMCLFLKPKFKSMGTSEIEVGVGSFELLNTFVANDGLKGYPKKIGAAAGSEYSPARAMGGYSCQVLAKGVADANIRREVKALWISKGFQPSPINSCWGVDFFYREQEDGPKNGKAPVDADVLVQDAPGPLPAFLIEAAIYFPMKWAGAFKVDDKSDAATPPLFYINWFCQSDKSAAPQAGGQALITEAEYTAITKTNWGVLETEIGTSSAAGKDATNCPAFTAAAPATPPAVKCSDVPKQIDDGDEKSAGGGRLAISKD